MSLNILGIISHISNGRHSHYIEYAYLFEDTAVLVAPSGRKMNKGMNFPQKQILALQSWFLSPDKVWEIEMLERMELVKLEIWVGFR